MLYVYNNNVRDENNPTVGFERVRFALEIEPAKVVMYIPLPPVSITVY